MGLLLMVMLASSAAELMTLAAVVPFMAVLANPEALWNHQMVQMCATVLGIDSARGMVLPMTVAFALAALVAGAIRLLNLWLNGRLAAAIGSDLSSEAYRRTLYQSYSVHLMRNSSELIASLITDVQTVITSALNPLLLLMSSALIALTLLATLVSIDWQITVGVGMIVALTYALAMAASRMSLQRIGKNLVALNRQLIKSLQEGLGAIRDVLLDGSQSYYTRTYCEVDLALRRYQSDVSFLSAYPRFLLEPLGMALIAVLAFLVVQKDGIERALPLLGALALGFQRLLPVVQKIYEGWAQTRNAKDSLMVVLELVSQPLPLVLNERRAEPLVMSQGLRFEDIYFGYSAKSPEVLRGINLEIRLGERIGIIGTTGSGKSTLIDLMMGLLEPTAGKILIDGENLHEREHPERLSSWRATIAHVPQTIFLSDKTVAENIAFGLSRKEIDMEMVRKAAEQAQISGFIESCTDCYQTLVGEHGVRLSGGQRQRIGIARALYRKAKVLVFDEATSALDSATEQAVMEAIELLSNKLTIVMVAHRLTTIDRCDRVIRLANGVIECQGTPRQVLSYS